MLGETKNRGHTKSKQSIYAIFDSLSRQQIFAILKKGSLN
ncbi:hypothetical protein D1BOALGB6SA_3467 [Olavius sp. associated proteobacterium Delta 1]|nr:hypothetical protein D1BOALGB6SA_3467 [Olavius sp. associated proteobacterium Delta 1]